MQGLEGTHLRRHHTDESRFLSAYGVFFGDTRHPSGEPVPTGSLRKPQNMSLNETHHKMTPGPLSAYIIQPTLSLRVLAPKSSHPGAKTLPSNRSVGLNSTVYQYNTGSTYQSTSGMRKRARAPSALTITVDFSLPPGLPPSQYKAWSSEYLDEYRVPTVRKDLLRELTSTHSTADALRAARYQFQGYPHAFKSYSPSSLTNRGQIKPDYESRVMAF